MSVLFFERNERGLPNDNINKIDMDSSKESRRKKRRQSNMLGYYLLVLVLAAGVVATLSFTVFFNIKYFEISSNTSYQLVDIAKASKVNKGDNLLRLDTEKVRKNILDTMLYVDDVKVKKSFPFTLKIDLVPSEELAYIYSDDKYILISKSWRILDSAEAVKNKELMIVEGFEPSSDQLMTIMKEKKTEETTDDSSSDSTITKNENDELRTEILENLFGIIEKRKIKSINRINISDPYEISINYDNRIQIIVGDGNDLEYKMRLAYQILTDEPLSRKNKKGYLIYQGNSQYSYVTEEDYKEVENRIESLKRNSASKSEEAVSETEPENTTENPIE